MRDLAALGLTGVRLVISDAHQELKKAAEKVFGATWQRCRVHFMRNALAYVPKRQQQVVAAVIRTAFVQPTGTEAREQWRETVDRLRDRLPKLAALMDDAEAKVLAFTGFPKEHWKQIASTNPLERVNKEINRRSNVIGIFHNDAAIMRLVGSLIVEQSEELHLIRRYMSHESLVKVLNPDIESKLLEAREVA